MVFSNLFFLYVFMPVLFLAYYIIRNNTWRRGVLVVFSLLFYAWGEPVCVFLMIGLVLADYLFGLLIDGSEKKSGRRLWLTLAIIVNVGTLVAFKYLGFLTESVNSLLHTGIPVVSLAMPIGISFFTFQSMSYVIDVYRTDTEVQRSFFRLLLYVSFFPQLIAGPIVRYKDIEEQLEDRSVLPGEFNDGFFRFAIGLGKKVLIADSCAVVIDSLYGLTDVTFLSRWAGALFFTLQLYFDFSGYSDMAIGLGQMFGFRFHENFRFPLAAGSVTDFWRRWHISLGTFFRDYVYIPLGGNRHAQWRNILIVWLLTGMWHGASWNFLLWGLYYGILLMWEKALLLPFLEKWPKFLAGLFSHFYTVLITVFGFAIFYFDKDLWHNLGYLFGRGCTGFSDIFTGAILADNIYLLAAAVLLATPLIPWLLKKLSRGLHVSYPVRRVLKTAVLLILIAVSTVRLVGDSYSPFLYFRF